MEAPQSGYCWFVLAVLTPLGGAGEGSAGKVVEALNTGRTKRRKSHKSLYRKALTGDVGACCFWLKNRRPSEWRDVQHLDQAVGHYIVSDKPMSEDEWIETRTRLAPKAIEGDVAAPLSQDHADTDKPLE